MSSLFPKLCYLFSSFIIRLLFDNIGDVSCVCSNLAFLSHLHTINVGPGTSYIPLLYLKKFICVIFTKPKLYCAGTKMFWLEHFNWILAVFYSLEPLFLHGCVGLVFDHQRASSWELTVCCYVNNSWQDVKNWDISLEFSHLKRETL